MQNQITSKRIHFSLCILMILFLNSSVYSQQFIKKTLTAPTVGKSNTLLGYGHFNSDNHIDFVANFDEGSTDKDIVLLINDGNNNSTPINIDLNNREVTKLKAGDINGDGLDDLVVYEHDTKEIVWFLSEYLSFRERNVISENTATGYIPPITVTDINNDGYSDIIYNTGSPTKVHYGGPSGPGSAKTIYNNRQEIILLDYNNDGLLDFLYHNTLGVKVYIQNENQTFTSLTVQSTEIDYDFAAFINLDADPELELVRSKVSQSTTTPGTTSKYDLIYFDNSITGLGSTERILLSNIDEVKALTSMISSNTSEIKLMIETYRRTKIGQTFNTNAYINTYSAENGLLEPRTNFSQFDDYLNIEVVDIDLDGLDEIIWTSQDAGIVGYFDDDDNLITANPSNLEIDDFTLVNDPITGKNNAYIFDQNINQNLHKLSEDATGKYYLEQENAILNTSPSNLSLLNSSHLNSDDKIDFVYRTLDGLMSLVSNGNAYINSTLEVGNTSRPQIQFSDVELDGDFDIIVGLSSSFQPGWIDNQLQLYRNLGDGTFDKELIDEDINLRSMDIVDIDGNGYDDIITNGYIFLNENGSYTKSENTNLVSKWQLQSGDIDNDGDQDLVSVEKLQYSSNYRLYIHRQDSSGNINVENAGFLPHLLGFENSRDITLVDLIDMDGDGDLDLPLIYERNDYFDDQVASQLHWLENQNGERFISHMIDRNVELEKCEVRDLNNDGSQDLLCQTNIGGLNGYFNTSNKASVRIFAFLDKNQNGLKDNDENFYPDFQITIDNQNQITTAETQDGKIAYLDEGNYEIQYDESYNPEFILTTGNSVNIEINSLSDNAQVIFGIHNPISSSNFLQHVTHGYPRCGKTIPVEVTIKNDGTETLFGEISLTIDPLVDEIGIIDDLFLDQDDNILTYAVSDFHAGQSITKQLTIKVPSIDDGIELGDKILLELNSELESNEVVSKISDYSPIIRCSFDPNDKAAFPDREETFIKFTEDILYNIRFQNTGNDTAYDISIYDTLSAVLDPSTFELISTSHRENLTTILDDNTIHFRFDNIYLPDSNINEVESHGFVSFKVKSMNGLQENTELVNKAYIYFDENPAIITNETNNILVTMLPVNTEDQQIIKSINIFPNPTSGALHFDVTNDSQNIKYAELRDITGKLIDLLDTKQRILDLSNYDSGSYMIIWKDIDNQTIQTDKVVLIK